MADVRLRYFALPPGPDGHVNMRLKRNAALLLCEGATAVFCDDDDWRAPGSVQAQLDALEYASAEVCTIQVAHVCEIDATQQQVRYIDTPAGGGIFSQRLGNPGTAALRRCVWEANPLLGFPDTSCEDVDFVRLLLAENPLLDRARPHRCTHVLLDAMELRRQSVRHAIFITVRLVGFHHEWPLEALRMAPRDEPPPCLSPQDVAFFRTYCDSLAALKARGRTLPVEDVPPEASGLPVETAQAPSQPTPALLSPPTPPLNIDAILADASVRMATASRALPLVTALLRAGQSCGLQQQQQQQQQLCSRLPKGPA